MKTVNRTLNKHLAALLAVMFSTTGLMAQQKALLFGDTFDRTASTNLNASSDGQSGSLSPLTYGWQAYNATLDINSNTLRMDNNASDGAQGGIAYPLHNFTDSAITDDGAFSVTVDLNFNSTGGNRWMSVGVGQSLAELQAVTNNLQATALPADLLVGYKGTQDTLEIYNNGFLNAAETIIGDLPADPLTMRIDYTLSDFNSGSTVNYAVYFDDATTAFTAGSFTWSGTAENYISLSANTVAASRFDNFEVRGGSTADDTTPPTPDPLTWITVPTATSASEITMTATNATDPNGVEYYFEETSGNPGGYDSGWQSSQTFSATGLVANTTYTYTVVARDLSANFNVSTTASSAESVTTPALDNNPPTPDPMTWASVPTAIDHQSISMTAATATDAEGNGVEYYFACITGAGNDSGWQASPSYTDSGLDPETTYGYAVKARDNSPDGYNETGYSATNSATTDATPAPATESYHTFDNDGLAINTNYGGGMVMWKPNTRDFDWIDNGNLASTNNNAGNRYATVYSATAFDVSSGFKLDVVYNIDLIESSGLAYTASFGLIAEPEGINSSHFIADNGQTSLGVSLTDRLGVQGLNEINPTTGLTSLADGTAQPIVASSNQTFSLTVEEDGSFSYSINGNTPTTGTTAFDLALTYHFAVYEQYMTGIEIQSVKLRSLGISDVGSIAFGISGGVGNFSWYGQSGGTYELQSRGNLAVGGEEAWQTIESVAGADEEIDITIDLDEDQKFFRVKLAE
ncbi:hypothetical protein [Pontiella sp.]|uniref:hypothetical protein n=1 Tax=Pontiella sp. TaxID=2837462 RepID=UPI00356588B8